MATHGKSLGLPIPISAVWQKTHKMLFIWVVLLTPWGSIGQVIMGRLGNRFCLINVSSHLPLTTTILYMPICFVMVGVGALFVLTIMERHGNLSIQEKIAKYQSSIFLTMAICMVLATTMIISTAAANLCMRNLKSRWWPVPKKAERQPDRGLTISVRGRICLLQQMNTTGLSVGPTRMAIPSPLRPNMTT